MTINRCTVIILIFMAFALLIAGIALVSDNRPLWPGFTCYLAMLGCVVAAWLIDDECKPARRRAYRRQQRQRSRAVYEGFARRRAAARQREDDTEMQVAAFRNEISAWEAEQRSGR